MYRILNIKNITQNNIKMLSSKKHINFRFDFNMKYHKTSSTLTSHKLYNSNNNIYKRLNDHPTIYNFISYRNHSTTPHAEILRLITRKKKKAYNKKYTELLQVTDKSTTQTRTTVRKLRASQLSDFINKSNTMNDKNKDKIIMHNLDSLDNGELGEKYYNETPVLFVGNNVDTNHILGESEIINEILESCNAFKESSSINKKATSSIDVHNIDLLLHKIPSPLAPEDSNYLVDELESAGYEEATEILPEIKSTSKNVETPPKNKNPFKSKYHRSPEQEHQAKQHNFNITLNGFIEICVNNGMVNKAYAALQNYRYRINKNQTNLKITDINIFNKLLHGYAEKGNIAKVKELLNNVKEDKITATAQTYAAAFECIGRLLDTTSYMKLLQKYHDDLVKQGLSLNDIMDKSEFVHDQREIVLDAIKQLEPNFVPIYTPPTLTYSNKLLNDLNEENLIKNSNNPSIIMKPKTGFSYAKLLELSQQQLQIELAGTVYVKNINKFPEENETVRHYRKILQELQTTWRHQICNAFCRDLNTLRHQTNSKYNKSTNLYPYLRSLDTNIFADILLKEIRSLAEGSETYSPTVGQLYKEFGMKAQKRYFIENNKRNGIFDKTLDIYSEYCKEISKSTSGDNSRQCWQKIIHEKNDYGPTMTVNEKPWPKSVTISLGRFLFNILMRDVKIDTNSIKMKNNVNQNLMPAFYSLFRNQGRIVKEEIKPHPILARLYRGSQQQKILFDANLVPMVCPPQPWSNSSHGGYLITKSDLIRLPQQAIQQLSRINETPPHNLYPALDSLNQLASIPWKVNKPVLDIVLEVFNNGGNSKLDVPQPPSSLEFKELSENPLLEIKQDKYELYRKKLNHRRKQSEMHSLWCDALYRLSLANHFRDKVFWLPHNMDFRGRVYPLPPHLNHLGSDLARSLLVFHQKQPLGPDGFNWLKLHCINLTGLKKRAPINERISYANNIIDDILDSAKNPLHGKMWWAQSDEPWQTLACCMEIAEVMECDNPQNFLSSFPIHQDGSCNGLQHYAALGRDTAGAISVNLTPSTKPQDVYSAVAQLVEGFRAKDAANDIQVAKILQGFVQRKVIKQTVMTTVYGVTRFGARLQIARQLKDIDEFPKDWVWPAASYLTMKTFESLREMFTSTKAIQDWFTDCAREISGVTQQNVEWITPLGLPVVQPYNKNDKKFLFKSQKFNENFSLDQYEKPNIMKQKNAFPPNFIHSLDSSHMMLTSLNCEKAGLTFISVHDCFWTHACTVSEMNKICREQFVSLHSEPILEDLSKFMVEKYCHTETKFNDEVSDYVKKDLNKILTRLPEKGNFDLKNILKSIYFFS